MTNEEIINEVMGSFKMTVDAKGLKKLEKYIDNLEQKNQELKDNWNELKNYLEKQIIDSKTVSSQQYYYRTIYKYMQELEGNNDK